MRLVLHALILGNVLFGRASLVGCAPQGMNLLSAQIAMFHFLFFLSFFFCAFSCFSVCFAFYLFCLLYSCTTSPLSCCFVIRYMYLLDEMRSAQCLSDIGWLAPPFLS